MKKVMSTLAKFAHWSKNQQGKVVHSAQVHLGVPGKFTLGSPGASSACSCWE